MSTFKENLRKLLEDRKITAYKVWKDTGLSQATVSRYLQKDSKPTKANIYLLAGYFDVNPTWLEGDIISKDLETPKAPESQTHLLNDILSELRDIKNILSKY